MLCFIAQFSAFFSYVYITSFHILPLWEQKFVGWFSSFDDPDFSIGTASDDLQHFFCNMVSPKKNGHVRVDGIWCGSETNNDIHLFSG